MTSNVKDVSDVNADRPTVAVTPIHYLVTPVTQLYLSRSVFNTNL